MTERQSSHPDNDLIDNAGELPTPGQQGSSGGGVSKRVGSRAELKQATGEQARERPTRRDNPDEDEKKGGKTLARMLDPR